VQLDDLDPPLDPTLGPNADLEAHGVVGSGAMGLVRLVRDRRLGRMVALKVMDTRVARDPSAVSRFVTEIQVTSQLEHPNIVPVYRMLDARGDEIGYTMKLIQGETFREYLTECQAQAKAGRMAEGYRLADRLDHFAKVCSALAYAHSRGVVHRDLKPPNVMVGSFGEVYVMDWGIARIQGTDETLTGGQVQVDDRRVGETQYGAIIGTPSYMSPEQASGKLDDLGPAADQYALGLMLFELVTLGKARPGRDIDALVTDAAYGVMRPMEHAFGGEVPRELRGIVGRATAFEPGDRYPDVDALGDDVRRFLRGEEVQAAPDDRMQRAARWLAHNRARALGLVLLLVLLVAGVSVVSLGAIVGVQRGAAERTERMADLVGAVSKQSRRIDQQLQSYEALLEGLTGAALHALSGAAAADPFGPRPDLLGNLQRAGGHCFG
jgi:eukaryotic-like serine/threonine-protein kinase